MLQIQIVRWVLASALLTLSLLPGAARAAEPVPDPWSPAKRLLGHWTGTATGKAGEGTVTRQYQQVMNGRYIEEQNISRYPPQEKNKSGEVHEHRSFISYDKARKLLVLRQFHLEGFVNTYRQVEPPPEGPATLVFESESFENLSSGWRARESYQFVSDDEFIETFELAAPGKAYEVYGRSHFRRVGAR